MNVEIFPTFFATILFCVFVCTNSLGEIIFAVNCGGESHTDVHGTRYQRDFLSTGISSDYGKNLMIQRVVPQDQILYQTERYHTSTFGYEIPIKDDGDYVLVLKFSEVWFTASGQKVFDIVLNGEHTVVEALDIYARVGRGSAHDEIVPFSVKGGLVKVGTEASKLDGHKVTLEFLKGDHDNPKINAFYVAKGTPEEVPQLPPIPGIDDTPRDVERDVEEDDKDADDKDFNRPDKKRRLSGPPVTDPYSSDDTSSMMWPVIVAVGAFVPLVFCLCRL